MLNNTTIIYNFMYCLTLFTFIVIALLLSVKNKLTFFERHQLQHSRSSNAIFGHFYDVIFGKSAFFYHVWKYYNYFKRKHYKYGGLFIFLKPAVLIIEPQLIDKVLKENKESLIDVFLPCYSTNSVLYNKFEFDNFLNNNYDKRTEGLEDKGLSVSEKCHKLISSCVSELIGIDSNDYCDVIKELKTLLQFNGLRLFSTCYPLFNKSHKSYELKQILKKCANIRKKNDIRKDDLLQFLIDNDFISKTSEVDQFINLIANISCNIYSTVLFCLQEMCIQKDIQDELIGEIRRFKNENKKLSIETLNDLIYLNTVVKETFRKYPPHSVIFKKTVSPLMLSENLKLPNDTIILLSIYGIHHDANNFPNPETFDPDRFAEENEKFIKYNTYLPYGSDFNTINNEWKFTELLVKLVLIKIFLHYTIQFTENCSKMLNFNKRMIHPFPNEHVEMNFKKF